MSLISNNRPQIDRQQSKTPMQLMNAEWSALIDLCYKVFDGKYKSAVVELATISFVGDKTIAIEKLFLMHIDLHSSLV